MKKAILFASVVGLLLMGGVRVELVAKESVASTSPTADVTQFELPPPLEALRLKAFPDEGHKPDAPKSIQTPMQPSRSEPTKLTAFGQVVDPTGKPVAGATVYLREWSSKLTSEDPYDRNPNDILATTQTDQRGEFRFQDVAAKPVGEAWKGWCPWDVVATGKGYGLAWQHLRMPNDDRSVTVQLPPATTISGHIVDQAGKPVPHADVRVDFIDQLRSPHRLGDYTNPGRLELERSRLAPAGMSDAEGNVTIGGLPPNVRLWLSIEHENHSPAFPFVATTSDTQPNVRANFADDDRRNLGIERVFSLRFEAMMEPPTTPRIEGRVILADTEKPCPGCKILVVGPVEKGNPRCDFGMTDKSGRFVLRHISQGQYRLYIASPSIEYLHQSILVQVPSEKEPVTVNVKLPAAKPSPSPSTTSDEPPPALLTASGKAVDPAGKPVAAASVYLCQWSTSRIRRVTSKPKPQDVLAQCRDQRAGRIPVQRCRGGVVPGLSAT